MFGINSFEQVGQIAEGHFKEITKQENELYESRIKICRECPLFSHSTLGDVCDAKKCWDVAENKVVKYPGPDIICGCGCRLDAKARVRGAKCVLNKWN